MTHYYIICYYFNREGTVTNVDRHYQCFKDAFKDDEKSHEAKFIVVVSMDTLDANDRDAELKSSAMYKRFVNQSDNDDDVNFLHVYNYGGTLSALDMFHEVYKDDLKEIDTLSLMEEDFYASDYKKVYHRAKELLNEKDVVYIGEGTLEGTNDLCTVKTAKTFQERYCSVQRLHEFERWTDGGFYFFTTASFHLVISKLERCHIGDQGVKYDHQLDGIDIGEVGFPTRVHHAGLDFIGLYRPMYFVHDD